MKKLLLALLLLPTLCFAQTATMIPIDGVNQRCLISHTITASGVGAFSSFTLVPTTYGIKGWYLYAIETDPGTTAPTASYDITVTDASGYEVTNSVLLNRSATATELVFLSSVGYPIFADTWTIAVSGNSVASAVTTIKFYFVKN